MSHVKLNLQVYTAAGESVEMNLFVENGAVRTELVVKADDIEDRPSTPAETKAFSILMNPNLVSQLFRLIQT